MFSDPDVLILDEPTRGIDVGAKYEIYTIINQLADEGKGVIVISSELPELLGICDRIYALSAGRITGEVPIAEATQETPHALMTKEKELDAMTIDHDPMPTRRPRRLGAPATRPTGSRAPPAFSPQPAAERHLHRVHR